MDDDGEVPYYLNNWLIANNMIPGLEIQIVAVADYFTGGGRFELPDAQDIFDMGLYVQLPIVDVTAPEILGITFHEFEEQDTTRTLLPMWINNSVTTMIDTVRSMIASEYYDLEGEYIENMTDLHRVFLSYTDAEERTSHLLEEMWYNDEDAHDNPFEYNYTNYDEGWDISEFENGMYSIDVQAWDTADNMSSYSVPFYIDTVAPMSELMITDLEGGEVTYLERGVTYLLTANATDNIMLLDYYYEYTVDGLNPMPLPLGTVEAVYEETIEFTVPEDIAYGAELEFTVTVQDQVFLDHSSSVSRLVFDSETLEMLITHVAGEVYIPNMHINGMVPLDILLLGNNEPDLVDTVAVKYRYAGEMDWMLIDEDDPVVEVIDDNDASKLFQWRNIKN